MATSSVVHPLVKLTNSYHVTEAAYKTVKAFAEKTAETNPTILEEIFKVVHQHAKERSKDAPALSALFKSWGLEGVSDKDARNIFRAILVKDSPASQGLSRSPSSPPVSPSPLMRCASKSLSGSSSVRIQEGLYKL